jgi:hypothetical protein
MQLSDEQVSQRLVVSRVSVALPTTTGEITESHLWTVLLKRNLIEQQKLLV